ncbi:MAG: hypothetical protein Q8O37_11805 [Sulfuricellaceae bacterium]|nr:hypothetical protein [Sulfuricellaceae bacterium]
MAKLSEQEQQDIIRHLEAGKPLPDKYRFLLFEDKREVELVWNGKTGEVCNVVLPFQVIEQVDEPRSEKDLNRAQPDVKYGFVYVDQESFEKYKPGSFRKLVDGFMEYQ